MSRLLIGILSGVGGLIIGGFGGRKTSNITMKDVKAAPRKGMSAVFSGVKWTGRKIGSGLSSLAFWRKKKEVKKGKVNLKKDYRDLTVKHQNLSERYTKLSDDFSETAKRNVLIETDLADTKEILVAAEELLIDKKELLRQADEKLETFQNTVDDKDTELRQTAADLKIAQTTIKKMEKANSEN